MNKYLILIVGLLFNVPAVHTVLVADHAITDNVQFTKEQIQAELVKVTEAIVELKTNIEKMVGTVLYGLNNLELKKTLREKINNGTLKKQEAEQVYANAAKLWFLQMIYRDLCTQLESMITARGDHTSSIS